MPNWKNIVCEFQSLAESGAIPPIAGAGPGHKDSWGMARSNENQTAMRQVDRQLGSAFQSANFLSALDSVSRPPHIFLCHLRKASPDVAVSLANAHPFFALEWAFMHNGTVFDPKRLPSNTSLPLTSDESDSEYLFHFLLDKLLNRPNGQRDAEALLDALAHIQVEYTALNALISNGRNLYTLCQYAKHSDYYTLYYYQTPTAVIICSQPLQSNALKPDNWQRLANHAVMKVYGTPPEIEIFSM